MKILIKLILENIMQFLIGLKKLTFHNVTILTKPVVSRIDILEGIYLNKTSVS